MGPRRWSAAVRRGVHVVAVTAVVALVGACGGGTIDDSPEARAIGAAQLARTAERYLVAPTGYRLAPADALPGGVALRDQLEAARLVDPGRVDISFRWILGAGDALVGQLIVTVLDPRLTEGDARSFEQRVTDSEGVQPDLVSVGDRSLRRYRHDGEVTYLWRDGTVFVQAAGPEAAALERFLEAYVALDR